MINSLTQIKILFPDYFFMDASALLLLKQLRELNRHPVEGISAGLIEESNPYAWTVILVGPADTLYEGKFAFQTETVF